MNNELKRLTPDEALAKVNEEIMGHLKIFIGYAPGVGKTYSMLNEANRMLKRNQDVVIGYLESHQRKDTEDQVENLKIIPRKKIIYNGMSLEEMDTDEIIREKPNTVLIDELAHTNVPGSKNKKRYQDVEEILKAGINVITTLNIQHLESLNDVIKKITGITVNETIPDKIVENADEVVVVDITPKALQSRLTRGNIYKEQVIEPALRNFFRKGNLNALREITLRHTAEDVDDDLIEYMEEHGINDNWQVAERVMVCITPSNYAKKLIRRGARIANRYKCEWYVVYVKCTRFYLPHPTGREVELINNNFKLAEQLGAEIISLSGRSVSGSLAKFALEKHITQIIIGHSRRSAFEKLLRGSTEYKLLKQIKDIEVHIIPHNS